MEHRFASGIMTCLSYPRGSEAQIRCLEEVGQDAEAYLKAFKADWDKTWKLCGMKGPTEEELLLHRGNQLVNANPMEPQVGGDHYATMKIQPVQFCHENSLGFIEGSVIKYVCRHRSKGGRQDLEKAIHFLQLLSNLEYGNSEPEVIAGEKRGGVK